MRRARAEAYRCNLSDWPAAHIEGLRGVLKGGTVIPAERDAFTVIRSLPHGHVAAGLGTARKIGLDRILGPDGNRCRDLVLALLLARILDPASKLATARGLSPATAASSLGGEMLGLGEVDEDELYTALDWLLERQPAIERVLARNVISAAGRWCCMTSRRATWKVVAVRWPKRGYSRDGRRGTLQIVYGLLCAPDGCPVAIEVFEGNTADPMTLAAQVDKAEAARSLPRRRPTASMSCVPACLRRASTTRRAIRPIYHQTDERIEAHIFVAFLAYPAGHAEAAAAIPGAGTDTAVGAR